MTLDLKDFTYDLPTHNIATHPLPERDLSKLLIYDKGIVRHEQFSNLADQLPGNALLVFNNTKVIPARLHFSKDTGAEIEIFLLDPLAPSPVVAIAMEATNIATWRCTIGNLKKWNAGLILTKRVGDVTWEAELLDREKGIVRLRWSGNQSFATAISQLGNVPLPPYIRRPPDHADRERYQTVYSQHAGAVAAPTAGLHFTENVFHKLGTRGIQSDYVTLHVSAGTFQPIKTDSVREHIMHNEQITVSKNTVIRLLHHPEIIAVGTTSMRTLESLYWFGVKLMLDPTATFQIGQQDPYANYESLPSASVALQTVKMHMDNLGAETITGQTSIYILPGYIFRVCRGLVTNFHQPGSTLIVLVAAFIGADWRNVYSEALRHGYRFLSYGDSSLLLPNLPARR